MASNVIQIQKSELESVFNELGLSAVNSGTCGKEWKKADPKAEKLTSYNPATGEALADVICSTEEDYEKVTQEAQEAFKEWRKLPAPKRGEIIRQLGEAYREHKEALGKLHSLEVGKITSEGLGEVQEVIDICDFATGLSRQLYGLTMHSERPEHRMYEQWHPLGVVGIITAFNFPSAVWAWNSAIAAVCGNTMVWKPSEKATLTAIAMQRIAHRVLEQHGMTGVMGLVISKDKSLGEKMAADKRMPLISATGSVPMGREVGQVVAKRFGKSLLELGGNNAIIVMDDADLDLAIRGIAFGAVGTAGQRCTTTRRVFVHKKVQKELVDKLVAAYKTIPIGNPMDNGTLMGPLIDEGSVQAYEKTVAEAQKQGGKLLTGGKRVDLGGGSFVEPTIIEVSKPLDIMQHETFAPILYICPIDSIEQGIDFQNDVPQGLSSAVFTEGMKNAEQFLSAWGSDCGIANVNIGTSGAEIGGAFGGEKETGGGRESGSDSWKAYMRRQTCTLNYGKSLPLAQGVEFL
ncbi:MAG: aldehyde dehydrogenase family protein [Magnetococcales bacterium]|nr:aldehyde dehydrogenase family protein [Magnetococcales bacterium]|tara:strand:- start:438270 stop:439823 length:1554 start_codon:yes stop_codon:yes gene_type:complete